MFSQYFNLTSRILRRQMMFVTNPGGMCQVSTSAWEIGYPLLYPWRRGALSILGI
jgi:hypothetical protein